MHYSPEQIATLEAEFTSVQRQLESQFLALVDAGASAERKDVREQLQHGAGRRMSLLRRCLSNIFRLFPVTATRPLPADDVVDVQINLHAFLMNVSGYFDNLAWAFVLRHDLLAVVVKRTNVGLFLPATQEHLPQPLRAYISSPTISTWHTEYLKSFRDALAHRIPLYVPPAAFAPDDSASYSTLEAEKLQALSAGDLARHERSVAKQGVLGSACPLYTQSFSEIGSPRLVHLHPQIVCDTMTIVEVTRTFLGCWHEQA